MNELRAYWNEYNSLTEEQKAENYRLNILKDYEVAKKAITALKAMGFRIKHSCNSFTNFYGKKNISLYTLQTWLKEQGILTTQNQNMLMLDDGCIAYITIEYNKIGNSCPVVNY